MTTSATGQPQVLSTDLSDGVSPEIKDQVFAKFCNGRIRRRNTFHYIWQNDVAQRMKIQRLAMARNAGLDESYDVGEAVPVFGPDTVINNNYYAPDNSAVTNAPSVTQSPPVPQKAGLLKRMLPVALGAAGALGLGGIGFGVASLLNRPDTTVINQPAQPSDWDLKIRSEVVEPDDPESTSAE